MPRFSETGASSAPLGISQLQYSAPRHSFCRRQDRRSTGSCRVAAEAGRADSGTPGNSGRRVLRENSCNARGSPSLSRTISNRLLIYSNYFTAIPFKCQSVSFIAIRLFFLCNRTKGPSSSCGFRPPQRAEQIASPRRKGLAPQVPALFENYFR